MNISPLIAIVPVVLAVALIIIVVRRNITERRPGEPIDIAGAIPAFVVLMVAVVFIGGMASSVAPYTWDEGSGELTIKEDVGTGSQKWDSLGTDVKSLILNDKVTSVADGAFDTLTGLEHISISDSVESITSSAFGVTLKDCFGQTMAAPEAGEYVGKGDGTLYYSDGSIYTYDGSSITGLTAESSSAAFLVMPSKHGGTTLTSIGQSAFTGNTAITFVAFLPGTGISSVGQSAFQGCTGITDLKLGAGSIGYGAFQGCTGITDLEIPDGITSLRPRCFQNCSGIETVSLPASLTSIASAVFSGCGGVTEVSFASGFAPTSLDSTWAPSWTFYDSDGTTVLDNAVAANLAGFTFQGIYTALIKVVPGQLNLTPQQLQQVQLHNQELQDLKDHLTIDPLPFQPSLQTEQEQVAA